MYNVLEYNNRLEKEEYIMPVLYPMAIKIANVQKEALENGDSLKIYESYRPYEVQVKVSNVLGNLMYANEEVYKGVMTKPWEKTWFISTSISNHQRGVAIDVSLVQVKETEYKYCGSYSYITVSKYEEYTMPTQIHELSKASVTFTTAVSSNSKTKWKSATLASSMTNAAIKMQNYFTNNDLTPLASEWWHFNDLDAKTLVGNKYSTGKYYLSGAFSKVPEI